MRNILVLFAIILIPLAGKAGSYRNYLAYTYKAEYFIVHDDYMRAQLCYDTAFRNWDTPFALDLANAMKCANVNKDYGYVAALATQLVTLGCDMKYFLDPEYLRDFRTSKQWTQFVYSYPELRAEYIKHNNWKMRTTIEQLQAKDQYLRQQRNAANGFVFQNDSTHKVDDTVSAVVLDMVKRRFPNEYDYGVFVQDDTMLAYYHPLEIILIHDYNRFDTAVVKDANLNNPDFTDYLRRGVEQGRMHPESYGMLNDRSGQFKEGSGYGQVDMLVKMKGKLYYDKPSEQVSAEIARNRAEVGLCSRELGRAKLIYNAKYNKHHFQLAKATFGIVTYDFEMPEKVVKNVFVDTGETL